MVEDAHIGWYNSRRSTIGRPEVNYRQNAIQHKVPVRLKYELEVARGREKDVARIQLVLSAPQRIRNRQIRAGRHKIRKIYHSQPPTTQCVPA
jgi:ribosomal protein L16/L10AE